MTVAILCSSERRELLRIAFGIVRDRDEAEDVVQEVLMNMLLSESLERPSNYARRAVRNVAITHLRRARRIESCDDSIGLVFEQRDSAQLYEAVERAERVKAAIMLLPRRLSDVARMLWLEGKTRRVVADELGITLKTVENHVTRARKLISTSVTLEVEARCCAGARPRKRSSRMS